VRTDVLVHDERMGRRVGHHCITSVISRSESCCHAITNCCFTCANCSRFRINFVWVDDGSAEIELLVELMTGTSK
jgi:hypothetical protein